jgi:hypothetical protein
MRCWTFGSRHARPVSDSPARLSRTSKFSTSCVRRSFAHLPPRRRSIRKIKKTVASFVRSIAERDGWKCTRPGCRCRTGLQGNDIIPRSQGGPDEAWNKHTVCAVCHLAITEGRLKVSGGAPDGLTWEGPFGVIEKPLPLASPEQGGRTQETAHAIGNGNTYSDPNQTPAPDAMAVREAMALYGSQRLYLGSPRGGKSDHVITRREGHSHVSYPLSGIQNRIEDCFSSPPQAG